MIRWIILVSSQPEGKAAGSSDGGHADDPAKREGIGYGASG